MHLTFCALALLAAPSFARTGGGTTGDTGTTGGTTTGCTTTGGTTTVDTADSGGAPSGGYACSSAPGAAGWLWVPLAGLALRRRSRSSGNAA